jgi:diketogulonate reductase-like aldo/keto reductase
VFLIQVHQIELHPYLQQNSFVALHKEKGVMLTAYAPLGDTNPAYRAGGMTGGRYMRVGHPPPLLTNPTLVDIGRARGCTPAQVAMAWNLNRGIAVHPKAAQLAHQKENFDAYKCALKDEDMLKIQAIEKTYKPFRMWDPCPTTLGLPCYVGQEGGNESNL